MTKARQGFIAGFVFAVLTLSAGCGVGRNLIVQPPQTRIRAASASAAEGNSPVGVPAEMKSEFQSKLDQYLYAENGFQRGQELRIRYRFIQYDPGSQFSRWFFGGLGNTGEGSL